MCGIAGLVDLHGREISQETIHSMTHAVSHRGPDGNGVWFRNNIALGHCRLAIVDLSQAANQPRVSCWVTAESAAAIAANRSGWVRAAALRRSAFTLLHIISIGLRSGE